jgi:tripartite-type tricarboxylate transporter receptor subunit TctC
MTRGVISVALLFAALFAAFATGIPTSAAQAQTSYPERSIRILVPIPPGGAPDVAARLIGQRLSEVLGQPVVIENRSGANGNIAADTVAKSPPDGYTLLLAADSGITINPHVYTKLSFDPLKDLVPVASAAANQFLIAINPKVPARTLPEFIEFARKADPPLAYASGGNGSQHQLAMEMLKSRANIKLLHVPYRGGAPAMTATIAGETQILFAGASAAGQFDAGNLRPLAASGKQRSKRFPNIPTIAEFYPGYAVDIWLGLFAPAGTPEAIVGRLRSETHKMLASPDFAEKLNVSGSLEPLILSPAEFSELIARDYEKYGKIVKAIGIKID